MSEKTRPPRDGLVRASDPDGFELRAASEGGMPTLVGDMLRFNEWTEINSIFEGRFMERVAPGAARKTLRENGDNIKVLFNHGLDPAVGKRALIKPEFVETSKGVRYEGELFDTTYNRDLVPGLEAGQYGSSMRFSVVQEDFNREPGRSKDNPEGIPERTITELRLSEGGPVTFPAYPSAEASTRSLTDHFVLEGLKQDPTRGQELTGVVRGWLLSDPNAAQELRELLDNVERGRKSIAFEKTDTTDVTWEEARVAATIPDNATEDDLRGFFAWVDASGDARDQSSYKLLHHENHRGRAGDANLAACEAGIEALNRDDGASIPEQDRQAAYEHLAQHLRDGGREPAALRSTESQAPGGPQSAPTSKKGDALHGAGPDHSSASREQSSDDGLFGVEETGGKPSWQL